MFKFINQEFDKKLFSENDILICAFGYESRSFYIHNKVKDNLCNENVMAFVFSDYKMHKHISTNIDNIIQNGTRLIDVEYDSANDVYSDIEKFVKYKLAEGKTFNIHVDYSSMPRKWYYRLPMLLKEMLNDEYKVYFWYTAGKYPGDYEAYPSAGIDSFSAFGKPSLHIGRKRMHIIGLSYDAVRTNAMISILDPDSYITCNAYNENNKEIRENVQVLNQQVISMANMEILLHMDDFTFMLSKLCEITNEFLPIGDVILVPDGPKPLIFAMSLVPFMVKKVGVSCLHVSRNKEFYTAVDVRATEFIYGFSI